MFIDDAFPDVTSIKNIKRVGELPMDGRTLRKKFNGGVYIKRGLQTPMIEALESIRSGLETTRIYYYFQNAMHSSFDG